MDKSKLWIKTIQENIIICNKLNHQTFSIHILRKYWILLHIIPTIFFLTSSNFEWSHKRQWMGKMINVYEYMYVCVCANIFQQELHYFHRFQFAATVCTIVLHLFLVLSLFRTSSASLHHLRDFSWSFITIFICIVL